MDQRRLGKSGHVVSEIFLGTVSFGLQMDEMKSFRVTDRIIIGQFVTAHHLPLTAEGCQFISNPVLKKYLPEFHGQQPA